MHTTPNITQLLQAITEEKTHDFWIEREEVEFDLQKATNGRFVYIRDIGIGGMGRVLLAHDSELRRNVAIKVLEVPGRMTGEGDAERFLREARITAGLIHPGIVPVYDLGVTDVGDHFFMMQVIEGVTLREIFDRTAENPSERMDYVSHFLHTLCRVCQTVGYAHHKGVMHLDLKPSNIMEGPFGEVMVVDWGVASTIAEIEVELARRQAAEAEGKTIKQMIAGTPGYMAPEQYIGDTSAVSPATDVYALGILLYEVLTTDIPFRGQGFQELKQSALTGDLKSIQECARRNGQRRIPKALVAICTKALALHPTDRYANAREMGEDLQAYLENRAVSAFTEDPFRRFRRLVSRYRVAATLISCVLVMAVVIACAVATFTASKRAYAGFLEDQVQARREQYQDARRQLSWTERLLANEETVDPARRVSLETDRAAAERGVRLSGQQLQLALTALLAVQRDKSAPILNRELRRLWLREVSRSMAHGDVDRVRSLFEQMSKERGKVSWWRWEPDEFEDVEAIREWLKEQEKAD